MKLLSPYCTVKDVQVETQNSDPTEVDEFMRAINNASRWIDSYCHRDFLYHDHTANALVIPDHWCAGNVIYLPMPIKTLTEIKVVESDGTSTIIPSTDYRSESDPIAGTATVTRAGRWTAPDSYNTTGLLPERVLGLPRRIEMKGTFGYSPAVDDNTPATVNFDPNAVPSPEIPAEISQACAVVAAIRSGKMRKEIVDFGGQRQSVTLRNIPKDTMESINRFRQSIT